jgi:hypothetical protein
MTSEALSGNGSLTGRGSPLLRGGSCGLMTTLGGLLVFGTGIAIGSS